MKYLNRGMANKSLRGSREFHVIFKFDTDEKATNFITKVKEWWHSFEEVKEKIKTALTDEKPETPDVKKLAPTKRKTGRPPKKVVQRQER